MGELTDKIKGNTNEAIGKAKKAAGDALDRPSLEAEGAAQELKGKAQKTVGEAKGALRDKL